VNAVGDLEVALQNVFLLLRDGMPSTGPGGGDGIGIASMLRLARLSLHRGGVAAVRLAKFPHSPVLRRYSMLPSQQASSRQMAR